MNTNYENVKVILPPGFTVLADRRFGKAKHLAVVLASHDEHEFRGQSEYYVIIHNVALRINCEAYSEFGWEAACAKLSEVVSEFRPEEREEAYRRAA